MSTLAKSEAAAPVSVRISQRAMEGIDEWRRRQDGGIPSRSDAIRRVVDEGLRALGLATRNESAPEAL